MLQHRRGVVDPFEEANSASPIKRLIHKVQKKYTALIVVVHLMFALLELLCIVLYVYAEEALVNLDEASITYYTQGEWVFFTQAVLCFLFTVQWILEFLSEEYRIAYLLSIPTLITLLTSFPMNIISFVAIFERSWANAWIPLFLRIWKLYENLLVLLDNPNISIFTELHLEALRNVLSLLCTMITCIGTFHAAENFTSSSIHLFECAYFIVVTFGTIGYGDVSPTSTESRMITIIIIIVAVYKFPLFFSKLAEIAKQRPKFTSFSSHRGLLHHVIVAGTLVDRDASFFLNEFFSGARKFIRLKIVLLSTVEFSQETRLLVTSPVYSGRVTLVIGDPSNRNDLERCDAAFADAIFLIGDGTLTSSSADYETIMKSMSIHQFDPNLPQHVMLRRERNSKFISNFTASIMEKERLKFTLLGLGSVMPGVIPLIVNLIRTYDPDESVFQCRHWKEQCEWSMGNEIYTFTPPKNSVGGTFLDCVATYLPHNITVIGIEGSLGDVELNPKEYIVVDSTILVGIASDKQAVNAATESIESEGEIRRVKPDKIRVRLSTTLCRRSSDNSMSRSFVSVSAAEVPKVIGKLTGHVVLVDLVSALATPPMSPEAQHEAIHFQATDLFNVMRAIKLHDSSTDIVLLTRFDPTRHFEKLWAETGLPPILLIHGCGLNMADLRLCNLLGARGCVVFSTGEGVDSNADAMAMVVTLSIDEILHEAGRHIPVVTEVDNIESLSLFPPYYEEDEMSAYAEENWAFEPNFIAGSSICSSMLDPALYQTYFTPQLLRSVDALIYGNGRTSPISCFAVPHNCATYADAAKECLMKGGVPIGIHRTIDDENNKDLNGLRFMFTNPPFTAPVRTSDTLYFLT